VDLSEVDLYNPDNYVESVPNEMFAVLRREAPVYRHPHPEGGFFWCVTKHHDLVEVNRNAKAFSSWQGGTNIDTPPDENIETARMMMLNMDQPEHTKLRKIVNTGFTPRRIREMQDILKERARTIVADIGEQGECDFVEAVAAELPLQAIADLLGVPQEDRHKLFEWSNRLIGFDDPEFRNTAEDAGEAAGEMYAYAQTLADERRKRPTDDIVNDLITAEVDGHKLDDLEFNLFFLLLAVAGNETTRNAISHGMHAFIQNPDQRQKLIDDPSLIDTAVEEVLRWATPVMYFRRTATEDYELHGETIKTGDPVVFWHISANRDEEVFDDPLAFDITRAPDPSSAQISFGGGGPHFCLGANLARAEIKVMFEELMAHIPDMELAGPVDRLRSNFINGLKRMPVSFTPVSAR
jgi:cholest-4-en-3-one 26-monooxygenase